MDAKQPNPSTSQRCSDYAWRRLYIRYSAARRPYKFQHRFYTRVAIAKDDVFTVKSVRVVTCRQRYPDQTRCWCDDGIIIYCDLFNFYFFNSVIFQVMEDEKKGGDTNPISPRQLSMNTCVVIFTQPRSAVLMSYLSEIHQSYQCLTPSVVYLVVVRSSCTSSGREKFSQFVSSDNQLVQIEVPNPA